MTLHELLDFHYGEDGNCQLIRKLEKGVDPNERHAITMEPPIHVATRRRRLKAVETLLDHGAEINARTKGGKTAFVHAIRRGFNEVADFLKTRGACDYLSEADQFAVAVVQVRLNDARSILTSHPHVIRTKNPEEDRLLADVSGRNQAHLVEFLVHEGADLTTPGMDGGSPLHQAAWFGQPDNVRILIEAGALLDVFDDTHGSSPIGWAVHGAKYSGGAEEREKAYVEVVCQLLSAGSCLHYPGDDGGNEYLERLLRDANPEIRALLEKESE